MAAIKVVTMGGKGGGQIADYIFQAILLYIRSDQISTPNFPI